MQNVTVKAVHENVSYEVHLSDVAYPLTVGGGKPGQSYPCVLIIERDDDEHQNNRC